jgi:two-component system nitrate/nitrite sensor histidine kinase NarX
MIVLLFVAGGSALATFLGTKDHDKDHLATDIINHQRELTSRISLLALVGTQNSALEPAIGIFQQNMAALQFGGDAIASNGEIVTIDVETDPAIRQRVEQVPGKWRTFRDNALELSELPADHPQRAVLAESLQASTAPLLNNIEQLASGYEYHMEKELDGLRRWQMIFLFSTIPLLLFGIVTVRRRVLRLDVFLDKLEEGRAGQAIDPLSREVYTDEVAGLVASFETMRPSMTVAQKSLEERVLHRTRKLMTAFEYSQEIVSHVDKNEILRQTLIRAQSLVSAQSAALCLIEGDGTFLELSAVDGQVAANIAISPAKFANQSYQITPITPGVSLSEICQDCLFAKACSGDNTLSVPLLAVEKQIGSLCMTCEADRRFNDSDREALQLYAKSVAIAISNYRLTKFSRIEDQQDIIKAERERLAAVLHDNLAQTLSYLNLQADRVSQLVVASDSDSLHALDELASMKTAASSAYDSVRGVLDDLSDASPGQESKTAEEISAFIAEYQTLTGLDVDLSLDIVALARLSPTVQQQALQIIRESLTNIYRHAHATTVTVCLQDQIYGAKLLIEDNGHGFDPQQQQEGTHLGLTIMQARAQRSGGQLMIDSEPNQGTTISANLPYQEIAAIHAG